MNARERIIAALSHKVPDHTPADGWFHDEVVRKLLAHYKTDNWDKVLVDLGVEGWDYAQASLAFPAYDKRKTPRPDKKPGPQAIWIDGRTYEDEWGVRHRRGENDWYEEWVSGPLVNAQSVRDAEECPLPGMSQITEPADFPAVVAAKKARGMFVQASYSYPYKTAWMLRGMDNVLCDYLINRDFLEALYDRLYALITEQAVRCAAAGVDMIRLIGDFAMQDRIIMGPQSWREVDKPRLRKFVDAVKRVKPNMFFFFHSDGNTMELVPDLIEIGFTVLNPIQPECMDPAEVKRNYGDRCVIHGGISLQRTLPFGSVTDVKKEVEDLVRTCGYNGGLVAFPSNVIQPDTPVENIIACFHTARDFDVSKLDGKPPKR